MRTTRYVFWALCGSLLSLPLAAAEPADSIYVNGRIYTVDEAHPWVQAVAIKAGHFVYVGSDEKARQYVGKGTEVIDLHGHMAMPGFHDAHTHLLGGSERVSGCAIPDGPFGEHQERLIARLKECVNHLQPGQWLIANSFHSEQFPDGKPDRRFLDKAFPDRPVVLNEFTQHNGLVNAKALQAAAVDDRSANPVGGKYVRDSAGRLTGELIEQAMADLRKKIPPRTHEQTTAALRIAVQTCNRYGITSVQEAMTTRDILEGLAALDASGELSLDVATHLISHKGNEEANESLIRDRARYQSAHIDVNNIKMFLDGTPTAPYFTAANYDRTTHKPDMAHLLIPAAQLNEALRRFDSMGMKVKMHASGAGAAHEALDAIEYARKANPRSTIRHEIAHTNLIIPEDMDRMKPLNVTADLSPAVWQIHGQYLGNPPQKAWQFRTLASKGMLMTIGTDWGVMDVPNLFPAIEGTLEHGDESIDLPLTLKMLTLNGAIASSAEQVRGTIAPGKWANFIVLDRVILEVPRKEIAGTQVLRTVFEGRTVFERGG